MAEGGDHVSREQWLLRRRMLRWCETHGVHYYRGWRSPSPPPLHQQAKALLEHAEQEYQATGKKQRLFGSVNYEAHTWDRKRRVMVKAEHTALGSNPRFVGACQNSRV